MQWCHMREAVGELDCGHRRHSHRALIHSSHLSMQDMPASDDALAKRCKALEVTLFDVLAMRAKLRIVAGEEPPPPASPEQQPRRAQGPR